MTQIGARALVAWPLLVAEILILGTAAFALLLAPDTQSEEVANALTPLWRGLGASGGPVLSARVARGHREYGRPFFARRDSLSSAGDS